MSRSNTHRRGLAASRTAIERVALWALDLSDAYRALSVNRREWVLQQMIWTDGVRLDKRCLFGTATMVTFFERVSHFVLSVAKKVISTYDTQHPYSHARRAWMRWRDKNLTRDVPQTEIDQGASPSYIYLDDAHGATIDENVHTLAGVQMITTSVQAHYGGRVRLYVLPTTNRPAAHLMLTKLTFNEAGWRIAQHKVQLGRRLDLLGYALDAEKQIIFVPEVKRRGLIRDIEDQLETNGASVIKHKLVERLVGRCIHIGPVIPEIGPYLPPMYRMIHAKVKVNRTGGSVKRVTPTCVKVSGSGQTAAAYQRSLMWLRSRLSSDVTAPLAPRLQFPQPPTPGVVALFSDAAREHETGYGGFAIVTQRQTVALWLAERWSGYTLELLRANIVSMAAGELMGIAILLRAILKELPETTHALIFTDSKSSAEAINTNGSTSLQMNVIIDYMLQDTPVQVLAIWLPGEMNTQADNLSRGREHEFLQAAQANNLKTKQLKPDNSIHTLISRVVAAPQRGGVNVT